ncbi:MAG: right-handed parallel beta-helix repeat-containing protein [Candidatus Woesearchaeota archaeon]|nr:right-handed parallel beta-helix repeat-containing protein [Candidatus Woesearchaeota archaeon]
MGKAEIGGFSEARYWQIASDQILSDNDGSSSINDMTLTEGDPAAVTISYSTDNFGVGSYTWVVELRLEDVNKQKTTINETCGNGNDFNVTSMSTSCPGGQTCTLNATAGTATLGWAKSKTGTVTWNILACTGSSAASPYNITTNETSTETDQMTWNLNTTANLITVAAPPDLTIPSVLQQYPANNSINNNGSVVFNCSATDNSNLKNISLWGNFTGTWALNDSWCNVTGTTASCQWNKTLPSNTYIWGCRAFDLANNSNWTSQNWTLIVDTLSPTFSNALNSSGWQYENVTMNITISNNAVDGYIFSTNITGTWANDSWVDIATNPTSYNAVTTKNISLAAGVSYGWKYYANDTAKNIGESITYNATVKTDTMPNVSLVSPADGTSSTLTSFTFNASGTDDRQLVNATLYWNYTGVWLPNETIIMGGTSNSTNFTRSNMAVGNYIWNVRFCDNAGNGNCNFSLSNYTLTVRAIVTYCNGNYTEGQTIWNVTGNITCANETIYVAGNITIFNNGSLTLYNVTINFSAFADGSNFINKSPNGGLFIYDLDSNASTQEDASWLMSNDSTYEYDFWAFGNGLNDNLTIRNSKFTDVGYATKSQGIQLYNVSNAVVSGNNISEGARYGLYLQYSTKNNISGNTINTTGTSAYGIYLLVGSNSNTLQSNTITTNGSSGFGISLRTGSNSNTLQSNTITTNGSSAYGIYLDGISGATVNNSITNNTINTAGTSAYGIYLIVGSTSNNISSNTITTNGSTSYGIYFDSSSSSTLSSNTITTSGSTSYGIYLSSSSNNNATNNIITTNGTSGYGIYLITNSIANNITGNTITTNGSNSYGIYLLTSSDANITGNTITTSNTNGFGVWINGASGAIQSNTITTSGSTGYGIYLTLSASTRAKMLSNTILTNGSNAYGIYLDGSLSNNFDSNITNNIINATGASSDGIYISGNSDNNILSLNNISKSGRDGIRIENSGTNIPERNNITNNIILNSTGSGIFLRNTLTASQLIYNNNISYSSNASITLNNASNITIISGSLEYSRVGVNASQSVNVTVTNATFVLNTLWDFYITNNSWIISLNNSFNSTAVNITGSAGDFSNFTVMWYARANVTNSSGIHMNSSSVTSTDVFGASEWTDTTTNGLTGWFATIDYVQNGTVILDYNLHTASASGVSGHLANSSTYNVSVKNITGTQVDIVLKNPRSFCNNSYTAGQATWNITSNLTCANQTIYVDGNITIFNNGSLTLYNVTINFSAFADGSNFINKSPNGGLYIYDLDSNASTQEDGSWLMSNNSDYEFDFWAFGNGNNDNLTIRNSKFTDAGYSTKSQGIQLYNVSNVKVTGNNISGGAYSGLYLQYSANNNISSNTITTVIEGYGIYLFSGSNSNTLQNNTITTTGTAGHSISIASSSNSNNITSNTITTNSDGTSYGIYLSASSNSNIQNNTITTRTISANNGVGIYLDSGSNSSTLQSNTITTSGIAAYGISLSLSSNSNTLQSNIITTNGSSGYGISLSSSSNSNILQSNTITTSNLNAWGIYLSSSNNSNISSNTITTNGTLGYGIYLSSSSSNNATSNKINATGTNADGIYIWSNSDNNIINLNNISKSGRDGIRIGNSGANLPERNNITNNIILNSTGSGIFLNNTLTASQFIYNNNISYSSNFSILLNNASNITIIGGSLEYSRVGVNASQSVNVTIANATFVLNTLWDFYITNNSWLISLNNSFNSTAVNITGSPGDFSNFTVMWYARANVTNSSGIHMNSSSVTSTDVFGASEWTDTTTNGLTGWFAVIDYIQNASSINSSNLHTGTASLTGYLANSSTYNVSAKNITGTQVDIVLKNPNKYCNNSYIQGQATWNITSNLTCANETIYVDGNITIFNNGSLTLYNVTINFSAFADGSNFINKSPNGGLYIYDLDNNASTQYDATKIMSNNSNFEYDFWVFGNGLNDNFTMQNSKVSDAGYFNIFLRSQGIQLYNVNNVIISGNNISDGAGYGLYLQSSPNNKLSNNTINTTVDIGIYLSSSSNSNIVQSNTITTSGSLGYGIFLSTSSKNNIISNTITTSGSTGYGIYIDTSSNNISSNTITTSGSTGTGIYIVSGSSNNATSNIINATGANADGIYIYSNSDNNIINSNNISKSGRDGIRLENFAAGMFVPERNNITNNLILNSTGSGIFINNTLTASQFIYNNNISYSSNNSISLNNASNITIIGGSLEYSRTGINTSQSVNVTITNATFVLNSLWDFYITNNSWVISLNNSFNSTAVNITGSPGDFSNFTVMWYARANVTNSSGIHMNSSSVTSTDVFGAAEWTDTTTNGLTGWFAVIDYIQNGTAAVSYNLHTGTASLTGYLTNSSTYNVSAKNITGTQVDIVLKNANKYCNNSYIQGQASWNITSNLTCANQTIYVDGNITIYNNASLTLRNVTINFSAFADGSNFINKSPNGGLFIYDLDSNASTQEDGSWLMSNDSNYEFDFWAYGNGGNDNFTMQNSKVTDAGYLTKSQGIQLYNVSNVVVSGNNVSDGARHGLYLLTSVNNNITGNAINTTLVGIYLQTNSNSNTVQSNTVITTGSSAYGIYLQTNSNSNTVQSNTVITTGGAGFGIYLLTSSNSNTLQSNTITTTGSTGYGIYLSTGSNSNTIQSNTVTTSGSVNGFGIFLVSSSGSNTVQSNIINTNGSNGYGIALGAGSNKVTGNKINASGPNADGIRIVADTGNNIINLNNITFAGDNGIEVIGAVERNNITNNMILNASKNGIFLNGTLNAYQLLYNNNITYSGINYAAISLYNVSNATIIGGILENNTVGINASLSINVTIANVTFIGNTLWDFYITNNSWIISLNNSFNSTAVNITGSAGDFSNFTVMWYVDVNVTDSDSFAVSGATVFAYENTTSSWSQEWTESTGANGFTGKWATIEYVQNATTIVNYTSNFTASYGTKINSTARYITSSQQVDIRIPVVIKYCAGNYTEGTDWTVDRNITCANETIPVAGNITILNNASLYLYNVTIVFQAFANGSNFINKSPNGGLFIYDLDNNASTQYDATIINTTSIVYDFDFWVFGNNLNDNFTMQNSRVTDAGYSTAGTSNGIQLYNVSNVVITGNNISDSGLHGLFLNKSRNNNISNNVINTTAANGNSITLWASSNSTIQNNTINTKSGHGIYLYSSSGSNISNNFINITATSSKHGLYLDTSSNSNTLQSNIITTSGIGDMGIYLLSSTNNNITANTITTTGSLGHGIELIANSNTLTSNVIRTTGSSGYGIYFDYASNTVATSNKINATGTNADGIYIGDSDNNIINLNNITKSGRDGIRLEKELTGLPERNNITNNIILNATGSGIFLNNTLTASQFIYNNNISYSSNFSILLNNASNITIIGGSLEYSRVGINASQSVNVTIANATFVLNTLWDFYIANNSWLISLNNSFNSTAVNITGSPGDFSNFTVMWYARANVTNSSGIHMNSSSVTSTDVYGASEWTDTTTNGLTGWFAVIDYIQNASSINSSNLHTGTASLTGYLSNSSTYNVSVKNITGTQVDIVLKNPNKYCNNSYTQGQATWNITSNLTCANQTIYVDGNITIFNNGSLTLYNVTINFSMFADGSNFINKSPNGGLFIYDLDSNASTQEDGSWLMSNDSNYEFDFWAFGNGANDNFTLRNSKVTDAGYGSNSQGIQLYNVSNVKVIGNNISDGASYGLYLQYSTNNNLSNNQINTTAISGYSIYLLTSSNSNTLQSNTITTSNINGYGIYLDTSSNSNITSNTITTDGGAGYGIYLIFSSNSNITSNTITTGGGGGFGIFLSSSSNTLQSNTITTSNVNGYGIYLSSSSNSNITSNTITTSGSTAYGIWLSSGSSNNATSNIINATGVNSDGVYIFSNSDNNIINLNNISKSGRDGIRIGNSGTSLPERNNITNNIILNSTGSGILINNTKTASQFIYNNNISYSSNNSIFLNNASNITIIGGSLEYSKIGINATNSRNITVANATFVGSTLWDFYLENNSYITSLNNSFNKALVNVTNLGNDYSNFTNKYYVDVNVTWANDSAVSGATVFAYENSTGSWTQEWTESTGTNGFTGKWATIEYVQNGTTIVNYTSNFTASYGAQANSTIRYITSSQQVDVRINMTPPPATYCAGNYTQGTDWTVDRNITCANETIYVDGNITILNNASLYLYNVTINFSAFADGSNFINKSPNGGLYIYDLDSNASTQEDATEIISNNSNFEYDFWVWGNGLNDNFTMQNSFVRDAGYYNAQCGGGSEKISCGIKLYNVSGVVATGNNISGGNQFGVYLRYSTNNNLTSNAINTTGADGDGIYLYTSANSNIIRGNTITTSGTIIVYGSNGIILDTSANSNNITSNTITTSGSSGYGIYFVGSSTSNTLQNNTIIATNGGGIRLTSSPNTIQSNAITTSGSSGYGITAGSNNNITGNTITTNGSTAYGIYLSASSNNNATNNIINATGSSTDGIYVFGNSDNNIFNLNNITKSGRDGIRIANSGASLPEQNNITNNIILNSTEHGIFFTNTFTASALLLNNNISYSGNASIALSNASNITIIGGSLEYSRVGINASQSTNITITNTTFVLNTLWDFYITNNSWLISLNNSFNKSGVNITGGSSNTTTYNYSNFQQYWNDSNSTGTALYSAGIANLDNGTADNDVVWGGTGSVSAFKGNSMYWKYNINSYSNYINNTFVQFWNSSNTTTALYSAGMFDTKGNGKEDSIVFGGVGKVYAYNSRGYNIWNHTFSSNSGAIVYDIEVFNRGTGFNDTIAFIDSEGSANGSLIILDKDGNKLCNTADLGTAYSIAVGDFNEDGNRSEVVVGGSGAAIWTFYSNCTQIWNNSLLSGDTVTEVETGDLDNDGYYDDIAVVDGSVVVNGYLQIFNGSGASIWNSSNFGTLPFSIEIGDIDNVAGEDILIDATSSGKINAYNGSGFNLWNFTNPTNIIYEIRFGNFSNNGIIAFVDIGQDALFVLNASGNQSWNASLATRYDTYYSLAIGDLDNDNLDDIVISAQDSAGTDEVLMFNNSGTNLWNYTVGNDIGSFYADGALEIADIDGDGKNDVIVGSLDNYGYVLRANRTTTRSTGLVYDIEVFNRGNGYNNTIAVIDSVGSAEGSLLLLDRYGNKICNSSDLGTAYAAAVGDFNEDGNKSEIVISGGLDINTGFIYSFYGNCSEIWNNTIETNAITDTRSDEIEAGDLDNDGYTDDIVVSITGIAGNSYFLVYNGSGNHQWNKSRITYSIEIKDIDGVVGEDIVVGTYTNNYDIEAYNGSGSLLWNFTDPTNTIYEIRFGNFSNNGIIAFVDSSQDVLFVLNASGNQSWNASVGSDTTDSLAVGDLDNDGLDDLVVSNTSNIMAFNYSGSGLWNYTVGGAIGSDYADGALEIADIDGDGKNDVIIASQDKYGYVLYANRTTTAIISNDYSNFTNQYYVDVNVTWSNDSAVSGATVFAYENSTGPWAQQWTDTTADSGFTGKWATIEYVQNGTSIVNYTSNFTANYTTSANSTIKYITSSQQADVRLQSQTGVTTYCAGNYTAGQATWNITSNVTCANQTIYVAGNITIFNNGSLTLYNVTINFSMFGDGSNFINKSPNGGLYIYDLDNNASTQEDATEIISNNSNFEYDFWVFGNGNNDNFTMQNSITRGAGYTPIRSQGIQLFNISNVKVTGNNISDGAKYGLYLRIASANNNISGNSINTTGSSGHGIFLDKRSNSNIITNNTITTNGDLSNNIKSSGSSNTIQNNILATGDVLTTSSTAIRLDSGSNSSTILNNTISTLGNESHGIFITQGSVSNNISGNTITTYGNYSYGVFMGTASNSNIVERNSITTGGYQGDGIRISNSANTTSQYNTITTNNSNGFGVHLLGAGDNFILNNTIKTSGSDGMGMRLSSEAKSNRIENNTITTNGSAGFGIFSSNHYNLTIKGNKITTGYTNASGIWLQSSSNDSLINNSITTNNNSTGIFLENVFNISIIGGVFENNSVGINSSDGANVTVSNATFIRSSLWDFYITNNSWVTSLNNSFNKSKVNVTGSASDFSNFTVQWYVDVNVTWSNDSVVSGATVFAYENSTGSWIRQWNDTTAATGFTGKWATIEYVQNATVIVNYTSNFTANYSDQANSTIKYITSSQQADVRLNSTAAAPPANVTFNITFLITKTLSPDMVMAASTETINVTTTVKVNRTTNDISFINITDEIPYDFVYENESRISVLFINWSDAGSNTIDITANVTKTIVDYAGTVNTWLIINISNMSTSLGYYMTENDSIQINYLMNSSMMNPNDTRIVYTNVTVKDIASNEAADFKLTNITSSQIVLRGYKKISVDPANPQNVTVGIEMQSLGGKLTSILLVDYLPSSITAKSNLVGLNITYYNKTSNSYKTLTEPEDYKLGNPYNSTLPDGQPASVFAYNFSYNFTNWDGTIYENDSILINYSIAIAGGGSWVLPAIIGGWDPQYQKHIKTEMYTQADVPSFDVITKVLTPKIKAGEDVKALLQMLNVGGPKAKVDVFVTYSMKTMAGELITERSETLAVVEQKEKELVLPTPSTIKPGMYTFETFVTYTGREAVSTDVFEVLGEKGSAGFNAQWLMFGIFGLVMVLIVIFVIIRTRKK